MGDKEVKALVGAAIALALLEALQEQGLLSAEEVRSIYLKARQKAAGFPQAHLVDEHLDRLARAIREGD